LGYRSSLTNFPGFRHLEQCLRLYLGFIRYPIPYDGLEMVSTRIRFHRIGV